MHSNLLFIHIAVY